MSDGPSRGGRRAREVPIQGNGFVAELDPSQIEALDLPARPDPTIEPDLHDLWQRMMRGVRAKNVLSYQLSAVDFALGASTTQATRVETSRNWAGARLAPHGGRRFTKVAGEWEVPRTLEEVPATQIPNLSHACSIWVGMGGHRSWSTALPQLGTAHVAASAASGTGRRDFAWLQWWIRGNPASGPEELSGPGTAMQEGDPIACWLEITSPEEVIFTFRNFNYSDDVINTRSISGDPRARARGVSAEWIVERPRKPQTTIFHPLPKFDPVEIRSCVASVGNRQRVLSAGHGIRMVDVASAAGKPERIRTIAQPRRQKVRAKVVVAYKGPS